MAQISWKVKGYRFATGLCRHVQLQNRLALFPVNDYDRCRDSPVLCVVGFGITLLFNLILPILTNPIYSRTILRKLKLQHDNALRKLNQNIASSEVRRDVGQTSQLTRIVRFAALARSAVSGESAGLFSP